MNKDFSVYINGSKSSGNYDGMNGSQTIYNEMVDKLEDLWQSVKNPVYRGLEVVNVLNVKDGNGKLVPDDEIIYIIWNLPCMVTCPNATDACKIACYAEASEVQYPETTLKSRYLNLAACTGENSDTFVNNMIFTIEKLLKSDKYKSRKKIRVRIHESGDFFSKTYAMQWIKIARHFINNPNVVFMAYTKSFSFFDGVKLPKNLVLRASIWQDTKKEDLETIKRNHWPVYMAIPDSLEEYAIKKHFIKCDCKDCSKCEKHCYTKYNKKMYTLLHGVHAKRLETNASRIKAIIDYLTSKNDAFTEIAA